MRTNQIEIIKNKTASIDVDAQNSFTPVCPDELPVPEGTEIVNSLNINATFAKLRICTKDAHSPEALWVANENKPQFSEVEGAHKDLDIHWNSHCNIGSLGFELIDKLPKVSDYDFVIYKGLEKNMHPYGACYHDLDNTMSTGLIEYLKYNKISDVIIGGLATDYCVFNTVMQLNKAGFSVILNLSACRGIDPELVKQRIEDMARVGVVIVENENQFVLK